MMGAHNITATGIRSPVYLGTIATGSALIAIQRPEKYLSGCSGNVINPCPAGEQKYHNFSQIYDQKHQVG